jgi:adenosylcobinamide kinase/adenosylcobinamide-phosphate guanylyltransferase
MARTVLVVGGQRSGKSRYAEQIVLGSGLKPVYLATATVGDIEMAGRVATHRRRRSEVWETVEEPLEVPAAIGAASLAGNAILVVCLTLWLSNLMAGDRDIGAEALRLLAALREARGPVVLVSNEVGSGVVPPTPLGRHYADALGTLNQQVAAAADHVVLLAAGLPLILKPGQEPEVTL